MKTFMKLMVFSCLTLFMTTAVNAQNCNNKNQSWAVKAANGNNGCVNVNYDENDGNLTMTMNFPREKTKELQDYLEKELGKNYTSHTGGLIRWTSLKNSNTEGFKASMSNGYLKIAYTGDDEDTMEEVKALVREVKYQAKSENKKNSSKNKN